MDITQWILQAWSESAAMLSLLAVAVFVLSSYLVMEGGNAAYPQGPLALPILGNVPQIFMCGTIDIFIEKYRKIYGNVFTIVTGGKHRIVVSGYNAFKELLLKNGAITSVRNTDGRSPDLRESARLAPGLFFAPSPQWKTLRTFALHSLRDDGMGRSALEPQIVEEVEQYITHFIKPNIPIEMTVSLAQATSNIISQFLFAKRFGYDDQMCTTLVSAFSEIVKLPVMVGLVSNIPFSRFLFRSLHQRYKYIRQDVISVNIKKLIAEQREVLDGENPRGLVAHFLMHAESEEGKADFGFSELNCQAFITQLYVAGTETTSTTLRFSLLYMCTQPQIQDRVQKEIDEQIGDREVTYKDRLSMPYTEAVLLETVRMANIVPTALPHTLEHDLVIEGKLIPGGSDLILNMASVLHDEMVFEEPNKFNPDRYLEGDVTLKKQRTIPFSIGRRNCLGESLAKVEMFMFFVTFMQRFRVRLPEGSSADPSQVILDVIRAPRPYEIIFTKR